MHGLAVFVWAGTRGAGHRGDGAALSRPEPRYLRLCSHRQREDLSLCTGSVAGDHLQYQSAWRLAVCTATPGASLFFLHPHETPGRAAPGIDLITTPRTQPRSHNAINRAHPTFGIFCTVILLPHFLCSSCFKPLLASAKSVHSNCCCKTVLHTLFRRVAVAIRTYSGTGTPSMHRSAEIACAVCYFFFLSERLPVACLPRTACDHFLLFNELLCLPALYRPAGVDTAARGTLAGVGSVAIARPSDAGPCCVQEIRARHRASGGVGHRPDKLSGGAAGSCRGGGSRRWGKRVTWLDCAEFLREYFFSVNDGERVERVF